MSKWEKDRDLPFFKKDITKVEPNNDKDPQEILRDIKTNLRKFIEHFQKSDPLRYLYEADIQADLAVAISKSFEDKPNIIINVTIGKDPSTVQKQYMLHPIVREYPLSERVPDPDNSSDKKKFHSVGRFDIACINPCMVDEYIEWLTKTEKRGINSIVWELPVLVAIEIKYSTFGSGGGFDGIKNDVKKMLKYKAEYHEHRNPKLYKEKPEKGKFTKDFKFIGLHFFQDDSYYELEIEPDKEKIQQYDKDEPFTVTADKIEYDHAYMISHKKIYEVSSEFLKQP